MSTYPTYGPRPDYFYVIDADHRIWCVQTMEEWAQFYEEDYRIVAQTGNENIWISTVFLGINHNFGFSEDTRPILFETMVFGGHFDYFQYRYCTYEEAVAGHNKVCEEVFGIVKA